MKCNGCKYKDECPWFNDLQQIKQNILLERLDFILKDFCPQDINLYPVLRFRSATGRYKPMLRDRILTATNTKIPTLLSRDYC